jgi:putative ABC transport system permease protein
MKAIIKNLLKSFWLTKVKFFLCVTAAILSAWGISTMIYSYLMTERDFVENFTRTNPPDLIITIKDPGTELLSKIRVNKSVVDIERRETLTARIKNKNGNWMSIVLFGTEDITHSRIGKFDLTDNNEKAANTILIEKSGIGFLDAQADSITLQLPGLLPAEFAFGGQVHDPGQAPSQMEQALYGYTNIANIEKFWTKTTHRFIVKLQPNGLKEPEIRLIGNDLMRLAEQNGSSASIAIPPPGEHPHQGIVDGISFLQKSFGTILSLLGTILLSLILITWLYPQITNIGIMKAVGASTTMVLMGYLTVLLLIIGIGMLIGLPLGYKTAKLYSGAVAFIQNFTPVPNVLPFQNHIPVALMVITVPILFALIPLLETSRTSVQNALNHIFYTPYKTAFKLTQTLLKDTRVKYSINNLFRSNQRTSLMIILMISGIALFTTGSNLKLSLKTDFANYATNSGYGITVYLKDSLQQQLPFIKELPFAADVSFINTKGVRFKTERQLYEENSTLWTFPPDYKFDETRIVRGGLKKDCKNCVYVNQRFKDDFQDIPFGTEIELKYRNNTTKKFIYSGIVKDLTHPGFYRFSNSPLTSYSEIAVKLKKGFSQDEATRLLDDAFLEKNIDVRQVANSNTQLVALENHLAPMYLVIQVMGIVTILIALAGLLIVLNLSMQERSREMGIIKALGGTAGSIVNTYHREYLAITLISGAFGTVIGYFINAVICSLFGIMLIHAPVPPLYDVTYLLIAMLAILIIQSIMISAYVRYKVIQSSSRLLTEVI